MEFWAHKYNDIQIYGWEVLINDYFFIFALGFLAFEIIRLFIKKQMSWNNAGDMVTNFVTLFAHVSIIFFTATLYLSLMYKIYPNHILTMLPNNPWFIGICILLADFAYYWEHRAAHRIGLGWATHTVHHSSPYYNISVAYRHGPLDAIFGLPFLLPLVFIGFDPILVLFSASIVQLYQTILHTDSIGKLPKFFEAIMNTPFHHRVHHGSNIQYLDKNYAGILIIWDKLFGTFEEEKEKVVYGVLPPIHSVNPFIVYFHGFSRLFAKMHKTKGIGSKLTHLIMPPGWQPKK